jgi:hypothetical protein
MRGHNVLFSACAVALAEARTGHHAAGGPVLCTQAVVRAAVVSRTGWPELARRVVTLRSACCGGSWTGSWTGMPVESGAMSAMDDWGSAVRAAGGAVA